MITLEIYKYGWNTKYLQYNPDNWAITIEHHPSGVDICGLCKADVGLRRSYGLFNNVSIRTSPIPTYVPKSDLEIWT